MDRVRSLIRLCWELKRDQLNEDEKAILQSLAEEGRLRNDFDKRPENEDVFIRLMIHPLLRGVAKVATSQQPYQVDRELREKVKVLGKDGVVEIAQLSSASIKGERWMTLLSPSEQWNEKFIGYIIPTFTLTTYRSAETVDFPDLLDSLRRGSERVNDQAEERLFRLRNCALLIVSSIDGRSPLYTRMAGLLNWFLDDRGKRLLSTVFVFGPTPTLSSAISRGETITRQTILRAIEKSGFQEEDPVTYKLFGPETHVCTIGYNPKNGRHSYQKIAS